MFYKIISSLATVSKDAQTRVIEIGLFFVVIIVVFFCQLTGLDSFLTEVANSFSRPLIKVQLKMLAFVNSSTEIFKQQYQLARKVQDLELRLSQATANLGELDQLKKENQELRNLLNSSDRSLGRVVLTQPILSYAQPVIGLPKDEEIAIGAGVLVEGTLVGTVQEVKQDIAILTLLWQKNSTPVLATTEMGVQGLVIGDGRRVLLTEVQMDEELEVGQRVVTTGQKGIEKGLLIGIIRSLQSSTSDATKTAVIEQYVSFYEAQLVEIKY